MEFPVDPALVLSQPLHGSPADRAERLAGFILALWDQPEIQQRIVGIVRSAATDPIAAAMMRDVLVAGPFRVLAAAIDLPDAELRVGLASSQLMGLLLARYVVRLEPVASMPVEELAAAVGPTIERYLSGELRQAGEGSSREH